jgi:putative transposase
MSQPIPDFRAVLRNNYLPNENAGFSVWFAGRIIPTGVLPAIIGSMRFLRWLRSTIDVFRALAGEIPGFARMSLRSRTALVAENLFLRKQLAFYQEREIRPRRLTNAARLWLVFWSRFFDWRSVLLVVKPATLIGWHRKAFRLFWRWKSRPGRRRIPMNLRQLIVQMVRENPTWGKERIAHELWLKLGIRVSPRTVRAYWPARDPLSKRRTQSWSTFVRNHARALVACDFMVAVTARFHVIYILVVMEIGSRRILHCDATPYPTAEWTIQQLCEAIPSDHEYCFLIHDRHATFSSELDAAVANLGLQVLKTPIRMPQANAYCERLIGSMRRECIDFMIPLNERHLRRIVREWVSHYNRGRPHSCLGPGIPDQRTAPPYRAHRHRFETGERVVSTSILGGLHHEYALERAAA